MVNSIVFQRQGNQWQVIVDHSAVMTSSDAEMGALCAVGMHLKLLEAGQLAPGVRVELGAGVSEDELEHAYVIAQHIDTYRRNAMK